MNTEMLKLYATIESNVETKYSFENPANLKDYAHLAKKQDISIITPDGKKELSVLVWSDAIEAALSDAKCLIIPKMDDTVYIERPIVMHSDYHIKVDSEQRIASLPNLSCSLVISDNILNGAFKEVHLDNPTCNISIDGGIWETLSYSHSMSNGNSRLFNDAEHSMRGSFGMMIFSNAKNVIVRNFVATNCLSYAVQISNCEGFCVENGLFENYHKDGVHINGHVKNGIVRNLEGKNMGDDMVALNAWDWYASALTYGNIENLIIENIKSEHNEFRLLPGRKVYDDGSYNECAIRNCVLKNIEGVYTFKLYGQPCYRFPEWDFSPIAGTIENVYFDNIVFPEVTNSGFGGICVNGLFEICADTNNLHFDNIKILSDAGTFKDNGLPLIKVGPLSDTYTFGSDNPDDWKELFYPDHINTAKNTHICNVEFADRRATQSDKECIIHAIKLTENPDYPNTKPKGGTGYGIIDNVTFE